MKATVTWSRRKPTAPGEYLLALEYTGGKTPSRTIRHVVIHADGMVTAPVRYEGIREEVHFFSTLRARGWAKMPEFPDL